MAAPSPFVQHRLAQLKSASIDQLRVLARAFEPSLQQARPPERLAEFVASNEEKSLKQAEDLVAEFVAATGLRPEIVPPRRYLWTDAFALCLLTDFALKHQREEFSRLAYKLIEQVHYHLGRFRPDDPKRRGWLSGLSEEEGAKHPTAGGLRIGKPLPERSATEPPNERLEWERDGQYFHYLTKWIQALAVAAPSLPQLELSRLAHELVHAIHPRFVHGSRIYWKMSVDLSRAQVTSMGHHDALDGFLSYCQVQLLQPSPSTQSIEKEVNHLKQIVLEQLQSGDWTTVDPLGLGGLLVDSLRCFQLHAKSNDPFLLHLCSTLLHATLKGLRLFGKQELEGGSQSRLAFREFGLSIGLGAALQLRFLLHDSTSTEETRALVAPLDQIVRHSDLIQKVHTFWGTEAAQRSPSWQAHGDINTIMLATSLSPYRYLNVHSP